MMNYRPLFKKSFSALLGGIVLATQGLWAYQPETQFWSSRRVAANKQAPAESKANNLSKRFPSLTFGQSSLPTAVRCAVSPAFLHNHKTLLAALSPAHGTLRKVMPPKKSLDRGPVVIHIQDVHMNPEAQKNIRETVFSLGRTGAVDVVALEGASGEIRLQPFWNYPNPRAVAVTADYLLKKNKISGPIHAALSLGKGAISFVGVDDPAHYKTNVQAYRDSAPRQEEVRALLRRVQSDLAVKKQTVYSPALLALDKAVNDNRSEIIPLREHVEMLKSSILLSQQRESSHPGRRDSFSHEWEKKFPEVCSFLKAVQAERSLNLKKVEVERAELIDRLSHKLSSKDMDVLLAQSVAFRAGQVRSGDFYAALKDVCRKNALRLADYPEMDAYVHYVLLTDEIDAEKLMIEISALEKSAYDRLAVSPAERALVAQSRRAWLTEKLVNFDLTRLEWEDYAGKKEKCDVGDVSSFESFYREADARDVSMANNLLTSLVARDKTRSPVAVLVTGGYHANGMADQLTRQGVTVISYVPKIGKMETGQGAAYLSTFSQEKTPLENLFVGERLFLAPVPDAGLAFEGTLMVPGLDVLDRGILAEEVGAFIKNTTGVDAKVTLERDGRDETGVTLAVVSGGHTHRVHVTSSPDLEVVSSVSSLQNSPSIINGLSNYFRELFIRAKRGRGVDPTVVVLPVGVEMGVTLPQKTFKADGSGILDFVRVPNYMAVNGTPVPWQETRRVWAENSGDLNAMVSAVGLISNPQSVGLPTNNVGLNLGYMVYQNGKIYHKTGETDQASPHLWVVISQDGQARLQTIQFRAQGDEWVPQTINGQDFPQVKAAFRGPTLIQNGDVLINPNEWEDLRHLFRLPVFDIPNFSGGMLTWGFADGRGQLNDPVLRHQAHNGEVVGLTLAPLTSYGVTSNERDRVFSEWGYIRRKNKDEIKDRGDYFVDETHNEVFIKLLPGYHPHTVVGQNRQGQLVAVAVIGETNKTGATLESLAEDLKRRGIVNAVVVGNGKDSRIFSGGKSTAVDGAYPTATALLSFFPPHNAAGTPQPIPDEDTIQKHLTRIQGELEEMEEDSYEIHLPRIRNELLQSGLDHDKVEAIFNGTLDLLKKGKYFIRSDVQVRIAVFGLDGVPLVGPLPPGKTVDDLTPAGDFDYAVVHSAAFWFGSVFVVAQTPDQKVVTLLRPRVPFAYHWTIPSGVLEPGRDIKESAADEVKEELGLESVDNDRLDPIFKVMMSGKDPNEINIIVSVFKYRMNDKEVQRVRENQRVLASIWESRGLIGLKGYLAEQEKEEGKGEALALQILSPKELASKGKLVPEIAPILERGFGIPDTRQGRATNLIWLKVFERVGTWWGGEIGQRQWGKAYKNFAATIELSSAFAFMLLGLGGTLILAGSPLGGAVAPLLGAVFGWRFYQGHFLRSGESVPMTPVKVSLLKAFTMAMIYGVLIAVTPSLLGFGPDSLVFFNPVLAESLWGLAAGLHLFFDRKPSARQEGKSAAQDLFDQLSTIQSAFSILTPITAGRTNQILNSGPFTPDRVDQTLERLQNDSQFRSGFLGQVRTSLQDERLSLLQLSLLSVLLAAKGEPLGVIHFLGADPEIELNKVKKYSFESVRVTVVAPVSQSDSDWEKTESLKALGVNVVRASPGDQGWTKPQLVELEKEMEPWLRSVPSTLLATVGNGVKMDPAEIERLDHGSRLKAALANAVGLANTLELYFRIIHAVRTSA